MKNVTKKMIEAAMEDIINFGETYIGSTEIMGDKFVCTKYNKLAKEVENRFPGMVLAFDIESGNAWLA